MSQQIDVAFQTTYEQIVEHLLQQKGSRLERTVRVKNGVKGTRWRATNQIGKRNATRLTSRHQRTVHTDTPTRTATRTRSTTRTPTSSTRKTTSSR